MCGDPGMPFDEHDERPGRRSHCDGGRERLAISYSRCNSRDGVDMWFGSDRGITRADALRADARQKGPSRKLGPFGRVRVAEVGNVVRVDLDELPAQVLWPPDEQEPIRSPPAA